MNDIQALVVEKAGKEFAEQALLDPALTVRDLLIALYQDHMMLFGEDSKPLGFVGGNAQTQMPLLNNVKLKGET